MQTKKPFKRIAVVIINYRTAELVMDCLSSLDGELEAGRDIAIVVDNASGDGSVERIESEVHSRGWCEWVLVHRSPCNGGFSYGNNVGMACVEAEVYILANSDTLVRAGVVSGLYGLLGENRDVGMAGPRLEWPDGESQVSTFRMMTPVSEFISAACTGVLTRMLKAYDVPVSPPETSCDADWISFAFVAIRREVIDDAGMMDDGFFMYFEDIDYCRRVSRAGWRIRYDPSLHVVHLQSGSSKVNSLTAARRRRPRYFYASRSRYYAKHYGWWGLVSANVLWSAGRVISLLREWTGTKRSHLCEYEWRDIWTSWWSPLKGSAIP